ncbi:unnamed protein product [Orchesella dallaii]|uniref:Gustatory receptor n=1 Tax=Orchesella dallaii TaxID=48710 RepID=A0ABP1PM46_9HEXA
MANKLLQKHKNYTLWIKETFKLEPQVEDISVKTSEVMSTSNSSLSSPTNHPNTDIASLYLPLIQYLRLIGFCPFTIRRHFQKDKGHSITYEFKWISFQTLYCLLLSVSFGIFSAYIFLYFLWFSYTNEFHEVLRFQRIHIEKEEIPKNISIISQLVTRLVPATFPLFSCVSVVGTLASLPHLQRILKRWSSFQKEYHDAFPQISDPFGGLKRYRNGTFVCFPIVGFIAVCFIFVIVYDCDGWAGCIFPDVAKPTFSATFTMLIMIGGHGSQFLMFRTLREAFYQIYVGIREETAHNSITDNIKSLHKNIVKWSQVIITAKQQVNLTSRAVELHHAFVIFINFMYFCLGVFACISSGNTDDGRGAVLLMFSCWGFGILTLKAFMCEKITEQVGEKYNGLIESVFPYQIFMAIIKFVDI